MGPRALRLASSGLAPWNMAVDRIPVATLELQNPLSPMKEGFLQKQGEKNPPPADYLSFLIAS